MLRRWPTWVRRGVWGAVLFALVGAAAVLWFRWRFERDWNVPHAVYATGQLVNVYYAHRQKHGVWPEAGRYGAKEVEFVRSEVERGVRVDVFDFGGGQYVLIYVHEEGLEVLPVRREEWRGGGQ